MDLEPLKELIEPNSATMEKFREMAPGTYKHCVAVAGLCEAVGMELGLDIVELRAAAMLHDVGKMFNAEYFTENQGDKKNPHDDMEPFISYHVLTRHVSDSVLYLVQFEEIPRRLIEIISQHHGTTVLSSIYNKAKENNKSLEDDHYRYKGSKPKSTEASILMIVDAIEATARAKYNAGELDSSKARKKVIESTVERLEQDEQLDELKIGIVRVIKTVLFRELETIYHTRTNAGYDDDEDKEDIED